MQQIANYGHDTAENILWHPGEQALYWLDIPAGKMFRGQFSSSKKEELELFNSACILQMEESIGGFVFCQTREETQSRFLLFASKGRIYEWTYNHGSNVQQAPQLYYQVEADLVPTRFNDVFALPSSCGTERLASRFVLCGTMPSDGNTDSRLLLFDVSQRCVQVVQQNLKLANGMGIGMGVGSEPSGTYLYFADTRDFVLYRFSVKDLATANIDWASRERYIDFQSRTHMGGGRPDGLCLDREGRIWLAETGAGIITCFSTAGAKGEKDRELGRLDIGTPKVTSCCLGGTKQDILFVSTQGGEGGEGNQGLAGGIFAQKIAPSFAPFCGWEEAFVV